MLYIAMAMHSFKGRTIIFIGGGGGGGRGVTFFVKKIVRKQ